MYMYGCARQYVTPCVLYLRWHQRWILADRNVLDCIVYLECCVEKAVVDRFLREPSVIRCLERYRKVCTILVPPLPEDLDRLDQSNIKEDKIRPLLQGSRVFTLLNPQRYHETFVRLLQRLKIPHAVLQTVALTERVDEVLGQMHRWQDATS